MGDRIILAGYFVLLAHICVKVSGFVLQYCLVNEYDTKGMAISDVFAVVYDTVLGTAFLIGEQCLAPAYLPVFTAARNKDGEARAWQYTSTLFNLQFLILAATIGALMWQPGWVVSSITQWDSTRVEFETKEQKKISGDLIGSSADSYSVRTDKGEAVFNRTELLNPEKLDKELGARLDRKHMAQKMLFYMAPGLLGMSLASLTYVLLNGYKEFFLAAFGDAVLKIAILLGACLGAVLGKDWRFIAIGAVFGGTAKLATHLVALRPRRLRMYSLSLNLRDPYVVDFFTLVLPLLAGILLSRYRDAVLVNVQTAQPNLPTYIKMARQISDAISFLVPYTLSIALLPYFCDISARDDQQQLGQVLTKIIKMLVWFFVPVSIVLAFAALPIGLMTFGGKQIGAAEGGYVARAIELYSLQLPFLAVEMMVMQAFFSSRRMIAPTLAGFVFSTLTALVPYFMYKNGMLPDITSLLVAVALAVVVAKALKAVTLVKLLQLTVPVLPLVDTLGFAVRLLVVGAASAATSWAASVVAAKVLGHISEKSPLLRVAHAAEAALIAGAGCTVYLGLSLILQMEEPRLCWHWAKEKLHRKSARH